MEKIKIAVEERTETGKEKVKKLRAQGKLIANLYGKGIDNVFFTADYHDFYKLLFTANGKNNVFTLDFGGKKSFDAIPYDIQIHPISRQITHVDFKAVNETEKVKITVDVKPNGTSIGVKKGGTLEQKIHKITIYVLPNDIMRDVNVDISELDIMQEIAIKDLPLPASAEVTHYAPNQKVFSVISKSK